MNDVFRHLTSLLEKSPQKTLAPQKKKPIPREQGKSKRAQHQGLTEMTDMVQLLSRLVTSQPATEMNACREFFGRFLGATSSRNSSGDDLEDPDVEIGF